MWESLIDMEHDIIYIKYCDVMKISVILVDLLINLFFFFFFFFFCRNKSSTGRMQKSIYRYP